MKLIQHIFLILALTITVGHTVVVHSHEKSIELTTKQNEEVPVFDFLRKIFEANIGSEHLENFSSRKCVHNFLIEAIQAGTMVQSFLPAFIKEYTLPKENLYFYIESLASHINYSKRVHISRGSPIYG